MKKFVLTVAALACVVSVHAQQRAFMARGVLQALMSQCGPGF